MAEAHIQLSKPFPINSPLNPDISYSVKDYSYTAPLFADGSNYPCKGYHKQTPIVYTAQYQRGQSYSISIAGSATHNGGSCQISISVDNGATFKVIKSILGGCPLKSSYDFTVPASTPAGPALLAWTWVNHSGNRELYMNCAWVTISNSARHRRGREIAGFNALPNIFLANIPQAQGVATLEGFDVTYPVPGSVVEYGGLITSSSPLGKGYTGVSKANNIIINNNNPVQAAPSISGAATNNAAVVVTPTSSSAGIFVTINPIKSPTTVQSVAAPVTTTKPPSPSSPSGACPPGTLICQSSTVFRLCNADGTPAVAQAVAPGMQCLNAKLVVASAAGPCSTDGALMCTNEGKTFLICSNGQWVNVGSVAPGTLCRDGAIGLA
jgi:hypothetical protein